MLDVSKGGKHVTTLTTTRSFYPVAEPRGRPDRALLRYRQRRQPGRPRRGPAPGHLDGHQRRPQPLPPLINKGNSLFAAYAPQVMTQAAKQPPAQGQTTMNTLWAERDLAVTEIAKRFVTHPWPTEFLLIVYAARHLALARRADHRAAAA